MYCLRAPEFLLFSSKAQDFSGFNFSLILCPLFFHLHPCVYTYSSFLASQCQVVSHKARASCSRKTNGSKYPFSANAQTPQHYYTYMSSADRNVNRVIKLKPTSVCYPFFFFFFFFFFFGKTKTCINTNTLKKKKKRKTKKYFLFLCHIKTYF
jgi:hypothetical protein